MENTVKILILKYFVQLDNTVFKKTIFKAMLAAQI